MAIKLLSKDGKFYKDKSSGKFIKQKDPLPVMDSYSNWLKGRIDSSAITEIEFKDSYTPTETIVKQWNADENDDGSIKCYIIGTKLYIVGNGSGKIMANTYSSCAFLSFTALTSITGMDLFDTSNVIDMTCMFQDCSALTKIYVSDKWSVANLTAPEVDLFDGCTSLVGAVPYDSTKTDASMANYTTGYLTLKQ